MTDEEHEHEWSEWSSRYVGRNYEKRWCVCGAFQARPIPDEPDEPDEGPTGIAGFLSQRSA